MLPLSLEQTGYRDSPYERPNQAWVCGWTADGRACAMGPDRRGRCPAHAEAECEPRLDDERNRYHCTRSRVFGGPCEQGPLPDGACCRPTPEHAVCQPRRSLRARRGRLVVTTLVAVIGVLVLLLAGPWSSDVVSPGELASVHQWIDTSSGSCAACHEVSHAGGAGWISALFGGPIRAARAGEHDKTTVSPVSGPTPQLSMSDRCLGCHFTDFKGTPGDLFAPHGDGRGAPTPGEDKPTMALALASLTGKSHPRLDCAVCHHEHRGADHDLTRMDDTSCQVCHTTRFASFSRGHPDFRNRRPTRAGIRFDHDKHRGRFEDKFDCLQCHAPDATGTTMVLLPFESSCTACHTSGGAMENHHGDQIEQMPGVDHLRLPFINPDGDGYWPDEGFADEELSTVMLFLLSGDDNVQSALRELVDEFIPPADLEGAGHKEALATAIKDLISEILCGDLRPRLARALGLSRTSPAVEEFARQIALSAPAVLDLQKRWLPDLELDPDCLQAMGGMPGQAGGGGWHHDPDTLTVTYGVPGHADPLAVAWLNALAAEPVASPEPEMRGSVIDALESSFSACLRCHRSDPNAVGLGNLAWRAGIRPVSGFAAHRFTHRTHFTALAYSGQDCSHCHKLAATAAAPWHGFEPLDQANCASCHRPGRANDSCLTCHYYHVNRP